MRDLLLVGIGGALGACARHLAARAVIAWAPAGFPLGTFLINITGCALMGIVAGLANEGVISSPARLFLATGILGGYTTFSAFGLETHTLLQEGRIGAATVYVAGQLLIGVMGVFGGMALARRIA